MPDDQSNSDERSDADAPEEGTENQYGGEGEGDVDAVEQTERTEANEDDDED